MNQIIVTQIHEGLWECLYNGKLIKITDADLWEAWSQRNIVSIVIDEKHLACIEAVNQYMLNAMIKEVE